LGCRLAFDDREWHSLQRRDWTQDTAGLRHDGALYYNVGYRTDALLIYFVPDIEACGGEGSSVSFFPCRDEGKRL